MKTIFKTLMLFMVSLIIREVNSMEDKEGCRFFFVRHGEVTPGEHYIHGPLNEMTVEDKPVKIELTEKGQQDVEKAAQRLVLTFKLRSEKISKIYCSPLQRAVQSAEKMASIFEAQFQNKVEIIPTNEVIDFDYGPYNGKHITKIPKGYLLLYEDFKKGIVDSFNIPGGESTDMALCRLISFLQLHYKERDIVVITHRALMEIFCKKFGCLNEDIGTSNIVSGIWYSPQVMPAYKKHLTQDISPDSKKEEVDSLTGSISMEQYLTSKKQSESTQNSTQATENKKQLLKASTDSLTDQQPEQEQHKKTEIAMNRLEILKQQFNHMLDKEEVISDIGSPNLEAQHIHHSALTLKLKKQKSEDLFHSSYEKTSGPILLQLRRYHSLSEQDTQVPEKQIPFQVTDQLDEKQILLQLKYPLPVQDLLTTGKHITYSKSSNNLYDLEQHQHFCSKCKALLPQIKEYEESDKKQKQKKKQLKIINFQ